MNWKIIESWIESISKVLITSYLFYLAWNELFKDVQWMKCEWLQVISAIFIFYFIGVMVSVIRKL